MSQRTSLAVMVAGEVLLAAAIVAVSACAASATGVCSPSGFGLGSSGLALGFGGGLVLVIGLVMYLTNLWGTVPPVSVLRANTTGALGRCPSCGGALGWVGPTGRWRCSQCGAYW